MGIDFVCLRFIYAPPAQRGSKNGEKMRRAQEFQSARGVRVKEWKKKIGQEEVKKKPSQR
jgi:hypothetical protein